MTRAPSLAAQRFTLSDLCLACAEDETAPDRHKSVGEALSEMEACHAAVELASSSESDDTSAPAHRDGHLPVDGHGG